MIFSWLEAGRFFVRYPDPSATASMAWHIDACPRTQTLLTCCERRPQRICWCSKIYHALVKSVYSFQIFSSPHATLFYSGCDREDLEAIDWSPVDLEVGDVVGILVTKQGVMQLSLGGSYFVSIWRSD